MDVDFRLHAVGSDPGADRAHLRGMAESYAKVGYGALVPRPEQLTRQPVHILTGWAGGMPVAGARLHVRTGTRLPTEINFDDVLVDSVVRVLQDTCGTVGEAAGMWVAPSYQGSGLSSTLVALAYASCIAVDIDACIGSSPAEIIALYESAGAVYIRDHPRRDTPLPGVTGYFFYLRLPKRHDPLPRWKERSFAVADEFRASGRLSGETLALLADAFPAPARRVAAGAGR